MAIRLIYPRTNCPRLYFPCTTTNTFLNTLQHYKIHHASRRPQSTTPHHPWDLDASTTHLPLHGTRILDLSRVLAGPFCTQILADYGASVIKVEQPIIGDETRQWRAVREGQYWKDDVPLMSLYYASINRNKRSVTLNLKSGKGVEIVKELMREADVVVNNFLPGKMDEMGLGYEACKKVKADIIYASVSGYGATGPSSKRAGYDAIALAEAGMLHITGDKGGGPTKPGVAIADLCTGLYAHGAILAALNKRSVCGEGSVIEGSLFETTLSLLINIGMASMNLDLDKGPEGRRRGGRFGLQHAAIVPYGGFHTGDGKMIFVGANNNRQFSKFCKLMEMEELIDDSRCNTNDARVENREVLNRMLQDKFNQRTLKEWLAKFDGCGLAYGPINDVVEALEDKQSQARSMVMGIEGFESAKEGVLKTIGPAVKFPGTEMKVRRPPPKLGEHTEEVLRSFGYGDIAKLREEGVI